MRARDIAAFTITVVAATVIGPADSFDGKAFTYRAGEAATVLPLPPATTGTGRELTYALEGLPPGMEFDEPSRMLSGTPERTGDYELTYTVRDDDGNSDSQTFMIHVVVNPLKPTFNEGVGNQAYK